MSIKGGGNAARAAKGKLSVAAGAKVVNLKEYNGGEAFSGDCLTPIDEEAPVLVSFIQE